MQYFLLQSFVSMEKGNAIIVSTAISSSLTKLDLNPESNPIILQNPQFQFSRTKLQKTTKSPRSLLNLCLGVVGSRLEDIISDLADVALDFPPEIKIVLVAIARRRKLLKDDVLVALADESWEVLDISGSDISDMGLANVAAICRSLRAVDISRCDSITTDGISKVVHCCRSLETLRCGGSRNSDRTARRCLDVLKPKLNNVEGDSWEELETEEIGNVPDTLRWLVWPKIDKDSMERYSTECPRIIVNPKPSPFGLRGTQVPYEALPDIQLDDSMVKDIDPKTWVTWGFLPREVPSPLISPTELSMAERFRLAFEERDTKLAPKRAKNARQHQRRAAKEWMMRDTGRKALALASQASRSLHS